MARVALLLLLRLVRLLLLAQAAAGDSENVASSVASTDNVDLDEESDSAAFMIVVEHEDEWRCGGSLLSQRTAVTTARCALGPDRPQPNGGEGRELWAFAGSALAVRPPTPIAATARRVCRVALAAAAPRTLALALLELERPFGAAAAVRPILLATSRGECERAVTCNAVRTLPARPRPRVRLRVVDVALVENARCASRVRQWPSSPRRLKCYAGDELCESDQGGGVVCDGKLCAVLGDTAAGGAAVGVADGAVSRCSDTYAALAVPHWRRFLHCAHTLRLCGRGDCARLCWERHLIDADVTGVPVNRTTDTLWNNRDVGATRSSSEPSTSSPATATRTRPAMLTRSPLATVAESTSSDATAGRSAVFEPNRADFKVTPSGTTPTTTLVRLKAGEYGDNAAEYESEDLPPTPTRTSAAGDLPARATAPAPTSEPSIDEHDPPALERRVSPPSRSSATSINTRHKFIDSVMFLLA